MFVCVCVVQCSEVCGGGEQQRLVTCPEEEQCDVDLQPSNIQSCNSQPCAQWLTGSWGQVHTQTHTVHTEILLVLEYSYQVIGIKSSLKVFILPTVSQKRKYLFYNHRRIKAITIKLSSYYLKSVDICRHIRHSVAGFGSI